MIIYSMSIQWETKKTAYVTGSATSARFRRIDGLRPVTRYPDWLYFAWMGMPSAHLESKERRGKLDLGKLPSCTWIHREGIGINDDWTLQTIYYDSEIPIPTVTGMYAQVWYPPH